MLKRFEKWLITGKNAEAVSIQKASDYINKRNAEILYSKRFLKRFECAAASKRKSETR